MIFIGIACTLGSGAYVLVGPVIVNDAGPGIIISFLIAGVASFLSGIIKLIHEKKRFIWTTFLYKGLSYAELGARVPRSGSAFIYIYVTIGEFIAFVIGKAFS